jgi:Holliday junction DNA helicase RuvA
VREDAIDLYGFTSMEELGFFKLLMGVSGVGPKTALGIMSVADVLSLKRAIAKGDAAALTSTFGIGKKSAERLVVELRDKIKLLPDTTPEATSDADVIEALQGLGYSATESRKALRDISPTLVGTRERLAAALRNLGTNTTA